MNALVKSASGALATTAEHQQAIRTALKTSLYPGATDASVDLVLAYCQATGYDPMKKPVHIVPMKVSTGRKDDRGYDIKEMRDVIMPGIGQYRTDAARTGQYAGCSEPEFGPTCTLTFQREVWSDGPNGRRQKRMVEASIEYPQWCRLTVRKIVGTAVVEFTAVEYWLENYASKGDDGAPNAMWEKRPFGQLAKCAEAQALRKAFPEAVGSQPTAEEMEGKVLEGEASVVQPTTRVEMPQARAIEKPSIDVEKPEVEQRTGILELTPGQMKMLTVKARNAGYINDAGELDEAALLEKHPLICPDNINIVLEGLRVEAESRDAA